MTSPRSPLDGYATSYHAPILVREILRLLDPQPGALIVDATLGGGGHSEALLEAGARVFAIDRDPQAIAAASARLARFGERFVCALGNYSQAPELLAAHGLSRAHGMLLDAGVSSHQLDDPARGFSFRHEGPLDMRMGDEGESLEEFLERADRAELATALQDYGELKSGWRIAGDILDAYRAGQITNTAQLAEVIRGGGGGAGRKQKINPATLAFQGLRIAINQELEHLSQAVFAIPRIVQTGGCAAFISFHSLEDRIVKQGFKQMLIDCSCPPGLPICQCHTQPSIELITRKPIRPAQDEVDFNPRSRSALLRAARVL